MTTIARLAATITTHMADSQSGITAMDRITVAALERRIAGLDTPASTAAIVEMLTTLDTRPLSLSARQELAAIAADLDGAPSFAIDSKAEARAACKALVRGCFQTEGVDIPDNAPTEDTDTAPSDEDADVHAGWSDLSFDANDTPAINPYQTTIGLCISGIIKAAAKHPQGYTTRALVADLHKVNGAKNPVSALAHTLDKHATFLAQVIPMLDGDAAFEDSLEKSPLDDGWKAGIRKGLVDAHGALLDGRALSSVLLAVVLDAMPD